MTTKLESAEEFAERILKGMGFDLDLIGDAPMHIANDIKSRDLDITHTSKESMREKIALTIPCQWCVLGFPLEGFLHVLPDQAIDRYRSCSRSAIRAIPLTSDAPGEYGRSNSMDARLKAQGKPATAVHRAAPEGE